MLSTYFGTWFTVMARPILFYARLKEEDWKEQSLTFLLIGSWLLAAVMAIGVFLIQFLPIGSTLVVKVSGWKLVLIAPVLLTLGGVFYFITLLIIGGLLVMVLGGAHYLLAVLLHGLGLLAGGTGRLNRMVQSSFYSSAIILAGIFPVALACLTRYGWLELALFRVGFNLVFGLTSLYAYGLWAVALRKNYGISKWRAFSAALVPALALLIFLFTFDKIGIERLDGWIAPLK